MYVGNKKCQQEFVHIVNYILHSCMSYSEVNMLFSEVNTVDSEINEIYNEVNIPYSAV